MGVIEQWRLRTAQQKSMCRLCKREQEPHFEAPGLNEDGTLTCYYDCAKCGRRWSDRVDPEGLPPRGDGKVLVKR